MSELDQFSREKIFGTIAKLEYYYPTIFKWFLLWELEPAILMDDSKVKEFYKYPKEEVYAALLRFKEQYPAAYKAFFLYYLEKPFSPFDREPILFLNEEDTEKLFGNKNEKDSGRSDPRLDQKQK
jgi:hypothetical protein